MRNAERALRAPLRNAERTAELAQRNAERRAARSSARSRARVDAQVRSRSSARSLNRSSRAATQLQPQRGERYADAQVGSDADPCRDNNWGDRDYEQHCEVRESTMPAGPLNVDAGQNGGIVDRGMGSQRDSRPRDRAGIGA